MGMVILHAYPASLLVSEGLERGGVGRGKRVFLAENRMLNHKIRPAIFIIKPMNVE